MFPEIVPVLAIKLKLSNEVVVLCVNEPARPKPATAASTAFMVAIMLVLFAENGLKKTKLAPYNGLLSVVDNENEV